MTCETCEVLTCDKCGRKWAPSVTVYDRRTAWNPAGLPPTYDVPAMGHRDAIREACGDEEGQE